MADYKPNSHRFKEEQKTATTEEKPKIEKVVTKPVKIRKKNEINKLADVFISEDVNNVKSYILMDILVPSIKKAIVDIVTDGVNMIFFGGTGRSGKRSVDSPSYRDYAKESGSYRYSGESRERSRFNIESIEFDSRGEAERVLDKMDAVLDDFGRVTVADLYDIIDESCPYTGQKYGWTNLRNAEVGRFMGGGYFLKLPRPRVLD